MYVKFACTLIAIFFLFNNRTIAQEEKGINANLKFNTRFDGIYEQVKDGADNGGFHGSYFNLMLDGNITSKFSYSVRDRLVRDPREGDGFFNSIDWATLTYHHTQQLSFTFGKQVILIGGAEYDYAPIDVFFWSGFCNYVTPYQLGGKISFITKNKRNTFELQMTNSPFSNKENNNLNIYSYNFIWYGHYDYLNTLWSVNRIEYIKGKYISYVALGNKINLGSVNLDFDFMVRQGKHGNLFEDYSVGGRASYRLSPSLIAYAKGGHDQNKIKWNTEEIPDDLCVLPGVEYNYYGGGFLFYPLKNDIIRCHLVWSSNDAKPKTQTINIGLTWNMNVLNVKK